MVSATAPASGSRSGPRTAFAALDGTSLLSVLVAALVLFPANLVIPPLGAFGMPANVLGLVCMGWWCCGRLVPELGLARGPQPVHVALGLFAFGILASDLAAVRGPLLPIEINASDRGLLFLLAWSGVALLVADSVRDLHRLETLLRRVVLAGMFLAVAGALQFLVNFDLTAYLHLPGLAINGVTDSIQERSSFRRVAGTATHPIEYGVVLAAILPLALHFALFDRQRDLVARWAPVAVITCAIAFSISRSAIIGVVIALMMLLPTWSRAVKIRVALAAVVLVGALRAAIPGLVGTILNLFLLFNQDTSTKARTDDYAAVAEIVKTAPGFGIGFGTYLPVVHHRVLDNQYLLSIVETGFVGVSCLALMLLIAVFTARGARRTSTDPAVRHLAQCLAASLAAFTLSFATFDALSFPMFALFLFILIGASGAMWRFSRQARDRGEETA